MINDPQGRSALEEAAAIVGGYHDAYCKKRFSLWLTAEIACRGGFAGSISSLFWLPQAIARRTGDVSYASVIAVLLTVVAALFVLAGQVASQHRRFWTAGRERAAPTPAASAYQRYRRRRLAVCLMAEFAALIAVCSPVWALALFLAIGTVPLGLVILGDTCLLIGALVMIRTLRRVHYRRRSWQI